MSIASSMRRPAPPTVLVGIAVIALVTACGGHDTGAAPRQPAVSDAQIESDVATAAAGEIASDIADYASADVGGGSAQMVTSQPLAAASRIPARTLRARGDCTENISPFQLVYAGGSDTLNIELTWYYFGSDGCESSFSSALTDSITYMSIDSLDINGSAWVEHSVRDRAYSVQGSGGPSLSTDTVHAWSGVGQGSDTSTYSGSPAPRAYSGVAYDTAVAVTFTHPHTATAFPDGGVESLWYSWTLTVTGTDLQTNTVTRRVVATLNGTNDVPLQVFNPSTGALELSCTLDLTAHRVVVGSCH
jgi:hypothetical protein